MLSKWNENIGMAENDLRPFPVEEMILHFLQPKHAKRDSQMFPLIKNPKFNNKHKCSYLIIYEGTTVAFFYIN